MPNRKLPRIAVTAGEPAGIGPDLCCLCAEQDFKAELVVIGDANMLQDRADLLGSDVHIELYESSQNQFQHEPGKLKVLHVPCNSYVEAGQLDKNNSDYVLETLTDACMGAITDRFDAIVTAPVHKGIINDAGTKFSGHTEFFGDLCQQETEKGFPVMMLAADKLRVALATTHLPLSKVSKAITAEGLTTVIRILNNDLRKRFAIAKPHIVVCGLNPHSGENGHLGKEEIKIIEPCLNDLREKGIHITGPLPADTAFTPKHLNDADVVLAMYHDQGLPVLKYAGFGKSVNITLGLPIIRTSVDHGTALDLAGTGNIDVGSFKTAIDSALQMVRASISTSS